MDLNLFALVSIIVGLVYVYRFVKASIEEKRFEKFAKENGCAPPYRVPNKWPWGLERAWGIIRLPWTGADIFDDFLFPGQVAANYTAESRGLFGFKQIVTSDPENFKAMLATKFNDFEIGGARRTAFGPMLGKGIFNSDGQDWVHARAMFRPQFNRDSINNLEETERSARLVFESIPVKADRWTDEFNIQPLFFNFTLDTSTAFLFGESVDSLQRKVPGNEHQPAAAPERWAQKATATADTLESAIDNAQWWLILRIRLIGAGLAPPVFLSGHLKRSVRYIHSYIDYFVQAAIGGARLDTEKDIGNKRYNLLQALVESTTDGLQLRDQALSIMAAGRDTTAALLSWTFYELSKNPEVFNKLRQAVLDEFGTTPTKVDFATLKSCKYLQHVLNETLRLWPSVPANSREAVRDTVLPAGGGPDASQPIAIRKGTTVAFTVYVAHRRTDLWGEDAGKFRPERWEGKKLDWSYIPFLGGPRVCLGQQYALTEAGYLTVRLLQKFDKIEYTGPPGRAKKGFGITLFPGNGVNLRMREAKA